MGKEKWTYFFFFLTVVDWTQYPVPPAPSANPECLYVTYLLSVPRRVCCIPGSSLDLVVFFLYSFPLFLIKSSSFSEWWAVLVSNQIFIGTLSCLHFHWSFKTTALTFILLFCLDSITLLKSPKWEQDCSIEGIAGRECLFFFYSIWLANWKTEATI